MHQVTLTRDALGLVPIPTRGPDVSRTPVPTELWVPLSVSFAAHALENGCVDRGNYHSYFFSTHARLLCGRFRARLRYFTAVPQCRCRRPPPSLWDKHAAPLHVASPRFPEPWSCRASENKSSLRAIQSRHIRGSTPSNDPAAAVPPRLNQPSCENIRHACKLRPLFCKGYLLLDGCCDVLRSFFPQP